MQIKAGFLVSCVGSVRRISLRMAGTDSVLEKRTVRNSLIGRDLGFKWVPFACVIF